MFRLRNHVAIQDGATGRGGLIVPSCVALAVNGVDRESVWIRQVTVAVSGIVFHLQYFFSTIYWNALKNTDKNLYYYLNYYLKNK